MGTTCDFVTGWIDSGSGTNSARCLRFENVSTRSAQHVVHSPLMQHSGISLAGKKVVNIEGGPKSLWGGVSPIKLKGREVLDLYSQP